MSDVPPVDDPEAPPDDAPADLFPQLDADSLEAVFVAQQPVVDLAPDLDDTEIPPDPDAPADPDLTNPSDPAPTEPTDAELAQQYREYVAWVESRPDVRDALAQFAAGPTVDPAAFTPTPDPTLAPAPPLTPEQLGLDLDDPVHSNLWHLIQGQNAILSEMGTRLEATETQLTARQMQEHQALANRAVAQFRDSKSLTQPEVDELRQIAANLDVLPSLMRGVDPVTNAPVPVDALTAVERALDIAYWSTEKFRQRELATQVRTRAEDQKRKAKVGALAGTSGSMPKPGGQDIPKDGNQMREMVAAAFASYEAPQ